MSVEENKAVVRHFYETVNAIDWSKIDWGMIDQVIEASISDDYTYHYPDSADIGPAPTGLKKWLRQLYSGLSNMHISIEDIFGEGNKLLTRYSYTYVELKTGKPVNGQALTINYFRNGKITDEWELFSEHQATSAG